MKRELLLRLQSEIENVTDAWLSTALKSLLLIQSRSERTLVILTNHAEDSEMINQLHWIRKLA